MKKRRQMTEEREKVPARCEMGFSRPTEGTLLVRLAGSWKMGDSLPSANEIEKEIKSEPEVLRIIFDAQELTAWDSGLLIFLIKIIDQCSLSKINIEIGGLPDGVRRLLALASAVPEKKETHKKDEHQPWLARVGENAINFSRSAGEMLGFIGEVFLAFIRMLIGKARFRRSDLALIIQNAGAGALPIVSLISLLVGLILAFIGAVQLRMFGAQIYVADLVAIAMAREMGAMMTAIIMAGRTGAAFAAQLGTMQVNEEIDALVTMGISPTEFLVLPRMIALILMMPLLCLYADLMGILGGTVIGVGLFDISIVQYIEETRAAVTLADFSVGLVKSVVFGVIVAISGCLRGMQCGRSSSAVGDAATSAVVTGILFIIVSDSILTVIYYILGI